MSSVPLDPPAGDDWSALRDDHGNPRKKRPKTNAATGASAAGIRALSAQLVAFYFRAPVKAFFRARVDYMAYARAVNPWITENASWSWRTTTPGLLVHAVKHHGWSFIPNQVLPPLLANVSVGAVLYTAYLQTLGALHEPASRTTKRVYPPVPVAATLTAGFAAGAIQSIVAAPLDALQVRFKTSDMLEGKYKDMWHYARAKLHSIGLRGVFAGWTLTFVKDSVGSALFFSAFETVKSQGYYGFLRHHYGGSNQVRSSSSPAPLESDTIIIPHYAFEPAFLLLAGASATIAQQLLAYPLSTIQSVHYQRLEAIDYATSLRHQGSHHHHHHACPPSQPSPARAALRTYYHAYLATAAQCTTQARRAGGWRAWLYRGFLGGTARQVPSTSAGLIAFELVRRKYAVDVGGEGDASEDGGARRILLDVGGGREVILV
ncbi:putative mitochondrial carrier protein [Lineolata rhizophorae]|uniref:Putative mitochondrial carrier protein n=1 Tax=Lineolata rhizophorae TaxID=578093 RepID=A0A6A6P8V3_9PEZI|nr:putative mitochondrial carrier protein [Lineolata rhizophorae]